MRGDYLGSQTRPSAAQKYAGCCRVCCFLAALTLSSLSSLVLSPAFSYPYTSASALAGFISGAILCIFMVGCRCRLARKTETENCYLLCYQLCVALFRPQPPRRLLLVCLLPPGQLLCWRCLLLALLARVIMSGFVKIKLHVLLR